MKKNNKENFIEKAIQVYSNNYDYSDVVYLNNKTKIIIKCNKCNQIFINIIYANFSYCNLWS